MLTDNSNYTVVAYVDLTACPDASGQGWDELHITARKCCEALHGRVISPEPLQLLAAFSRAATAVQAAHAIQQAFQQGAGRSTRIGMHAGGTELDGPRGLAGCADEALVLMAMAEPGQVLLSESFYHLLDGALVDEVLRLDHPERPLYLLHPLEPDAPTTDLESLDIAPPVVPQAAEPEAANEAQALPPVTLPETETEAPPVARTLLVQPEPAASGPVLSLSCSDNQVELDPGSDHFQIGRDATRSDWAFPKPMVSRQHLSIRCREGQFVVADSSTNGTFVSMEGLGEVHLQHTELVLQGRGIISLAVAARSDPELMIHFDIVA